MRISDGHVVSFHYTLSNPEGEVMESTRDGDPSLYLHGADNLLPGLEAELSDREAGERFQVTLPPERAYGQRREGLTQRVPSKYLKHAGRLRPGQAVKLNTGQGVRTVTVLKVGKFNVDVDLNHPLCGWTLVFDVEILDVRTATPEELAHGHAHGPGGHQHD